MGSKPLKMGANMEQKQVKISLLSRRLSAENSEQIKQKITGFLSENSGNWNISWEELPSSGLGRTQTVLTLCPSGVIMTKTGEIEAKMVFRQGKSNHFTYKTPYGSIPMTLHAQTVAYQASEAGGEVTLTYSLTMDSAHPDQLKFTLIFTPAPQ